MIGLFSLAVGTTREASNSNTSALIPKSFREEPAGEPSYLEFIAPVGGYQDDSAIGGLDAQTPLIFRIASPWGMPKAALFPPFPRRK